MVNILTRLEREKINDFKQVYKELMNVNNNLMVNDIIDALFFNVECYYLEFKDVINTIATNDETYKYHILQPVNGEYSLLDFLINRAITNIETIVLDENAFDKAKLLHIDPKRYDRYKEQYDYDSQFLKLQQLKSYLHETSHAMHGFDTLNDNKIHRGRFSESTLLERVNYFYNRLGRKYSNIINPDIVMKADTIFEPKYFNNAMANKDYDEGITEMYAVKYSGLLNQTHFETHFLTDKLNIPVPNPMNEYSKYMRFFYHLSNLTPKFEVFSSLFFENKCLIKSFSYMYEEIINKYWIDHNLDLHFGNFKTSEERINVLLEKAIYYITAQQDINQLNSSEKDKVVLATLILDNLFVDCYKKKMEIDRFENLEEKEIELKNCYNMSPVKKNKTTGGFENSNTRNSYKELYLGIKNSKSNDSNQSIDLLSFLNPENLWNYALGYVKIPSDISNRELYKKGRDFAKICAIPILDKATSNPSHREIDDDYIEIYKFITDRVLSYLESTRDRNGQSNVVWNELLEYIFKNNENNINSKIEMYLKTIFSPSTELKVFNQFSNELRINSVYNKLKDYIEILDYLVEVYDFDKIRNSILGDNYGENHKVHR